MATTNNIGLYCFNTGEEDAKTSLEALFGAGNSNMKKIDDAIGELKKKSFIVNTEEELNALLTEENLGKTVSFNGALYIITEGGSSTNAPIAVGDTLTKLYFNTEVTPDFSQYSDGLNILIHASNSSGEELVVQKNLDVGTGVINYLGGNFEEAQGFAYMELVSGEFDISEMGFTQWGWQGDVGTLYAEYGTPIVSEINLQEVWGGYVSKEPFTGGGGIIAKPVGAEGGGIDSGIESITIEGTSFIITFTDGTVETVEIDYESTTPATPADLSYLGLSDQPIIIGDLDAITPVATTYYKHNGADETTYTKGVIYFYDGEVFKPIVGGGGGGTTLNKYSYVHNYYNNNTTNKILANIIRNAKSIRSTGPTWNEFFSNQYWTNIRSITYSTDAEGTKETIISVRFSSSSGAWNKGEKIVHNLTTNTVTVTQLDNTTQELAVHIDYWNETEIT